jgi:hypothetical protein
MNPTTIRSRLRQQPLSVLEASTPSMSLAEYVQELLMIHNIQWLLRNASGYDNMVEIFYSLSIIQWKGVSSSSVG